MKKAILIFIGIFVGIFLVVSVYDFKSEYSAEVYLFKANKLLAKILRSPESIPPHLYEQTVNSYKKVTEKFPRSASAKRAVLSLGQVNIINGQFDAARAELNQAKSQYKEDKNLLAEIEFLIGNSFEKQEQQDRALQIYDSILTDYPDSAKAMQMPLYIARYLQLKSGLAEAKPAYQNAVVYYQKKARENPNSNKGLIALTSVTTCYIDQQMWPEAVDALTDLIQEYPYSTDTSRFLQMINLICLGQLKNPQKAIEIYEGFITKYPKHPLEKTIKAQIENLKKTQIKK